MNKRTGHVVGGHQRIAAMMQLGITEAPCHEVDLPETEEQALNISLNNPHIAGEFTDDLQALLDQLHTSVPELVDPLNLDDLWNGSAFAQGKTDPDDVPEVPKEPITKQGDLWALGGHRLLCGDATVPDNYNRLLPAESAALCFTDPPYGINYGAKNRLLNSFHKGGRNLKDIANDMLGKDELLDMLVKSFTVATGHSADYCSFYVTAPQGGELGLMMMMMMMMSGIPTRHVLIWNKDSQTFSMGRLDYEYKHEPILFAWKNTHKFYGNGKFQNTVWDIPKTKHCDLHPTMKPVALVQNAILNSSEPEQIVLDMFAGSGTTLIACQQTERRARCMEIDPAYCDVIVRRWEDFTGQKAERFN